MWRLSMFLLCLVAALSGTPLRQAEAADDFVRAIGELGQGDVIETLDGGVGDDTEASILTAGNGTQFLSPTVFLAMADVFLPPLITASSLLNIGDHRRTGLSGLQAASSGRWFAWIQCFLILMWLSGNFVVVSP